MSGFTISPDQRRQLQTIETSLKSRLSCEGRRTEALAVELAKLFAAFPAQVQSDSPAKLRMEAYFEALHDVPAWAVAEARGRIIRGETALETRFAPSPPDFAKVCQAILRPLKADLIDLQNIARADIEFKEPSKPEHERIIDGFEKLKFSLSPTRKDEQEAA